VRELAARGMSARRQLGLLAATLGLCAPDDEPLPRELVGRFDPARLPAEQAVLDPAALVAVASTR
jgi:hypothetical protein